MSDVSQPKPDTASASLSGSVESMALTRKEEIILTQPNEQLIGESTLTPLIKLQIELQQTREAHNRTMNEVSKFEGMYEEERASANKLTIELEQVKAERDDYRNALTSISDGGSTGEDARDMRSEADSILSKYGGTP